MGMKRGLWERENNRINNRRKRIQTTVLEGMLEREGRKGRKRLKLIDDVTRGG